MLGASILAVRVGVGNSPPSFSVMRGTHIGRRQAGVSTLISDGVEILAGFKDWFFFDIFSKYVSGFYFAHYSQHLRPQVRGIITSSGCGAKGLTWSMGTRH